MQSITSITSITNAPGQRVVLFLEPAEISQQVTLAVVVHDIRHLDTMSRKSLLQPRHHDLALV